MKELKITYLSSSYNVCGGRTLLFTNTFPTSKQYTEQLSEWDEMSIPALKTNIFATWSTRFHTWFLLSSENRFPPIIFKNTTLRKDAFKKHTYGQYISFHIKACGSTGLHLADKDRLCQKKI